MIVDAYVTRTELGLGNLDLINDTYKIEGETGIEFGGRGWRRNMVDSPFVHGSYPVTQVMDNATVILSLQVRAASLAALETAIAAVVAAFSQFEYDLYLILDDTTWAWRCYAADIVVGSEDERMAQYNVNVRMSIPRAPIPLDGGI
jgi:hypothetical protein